MVIEKTVPYKQFTKMWSKDDSVSITSFCPNLTRFTISFKRLLELIDSYKREGYSIRNVEVTTDYYVAIYLDCEEITKSIMLLAVLIR